MLHQSTKQKKEDRRFGLTSWAATQRAVIVGRATGTGQRPRDRPDRCVGASAFSMDLRRLQRSRIQRLLQQLQTQYRRRRPSVRLLSTLTASRRSGNDARAGTNPDWAHRHSARKCLLSIRKQFQNTKTANSLGSIGKILLKCSQSELSESSSRITIKYSTVTQKLPYLVLEGRGRSVVAELSSLEGVAAVRVRSVGCGHRLVHLLEKCIIYSR